MKKLNILITGDDGYKAAGIRIIARALKKHHHLKIAGTKSQQSAIGGGITPGGGEWGEDIVEGIPAFWVDGKPADAVQASKYYYKQKFDLILSGINYGANIGTCNSSGTIGAAIRALGYDLADKAIALSWYLPKIWYNKDTSEDPVEDFDQYPGLTVNAIIQSAFAHKFWGADFLNINLPTEKQTTAIFTTPIPKEMVSYYHFDILLDHDKKTYRSQGYPKHKSPDHLETDASVVQHDYISIVPWLNNLYLNEKLLKLKGKRVEFK